jgi:hypothetical protein
MKSGDHIVQLYKQDSHLTDVVTNYVVPSLLSGEGVLIIATEEHIKQFERSLKSVHINTTLLQLTRQLVMLDARSTLNNFMDGEQLNTEKFFIYMESVLADLRVEYPSIKAYGEMVNVLWNDGNFESMLGLENLWKNLLDKHDMTLLCAFSLDELSEEREGITFNEVCGCHSYVIPAEGIIDVNSHGEQLRKIAELQYQNTSDLRNFDDWKLRSLEMMVPLAAMRMHINGLKEHQDLVEMGAVVSKFEQQLDRMTRIVERLAQ